MKKKELKLLLIDLIDKYGEVDVKDRYLHIYSDVKNDFFKCLFAIFHQSLDESFEFMNTKGDTNNHYNADDSRFLLKPIEDLRYFMKSTIKTDYAFDLNKTYVEKINDAKSFLQLSGGSPIPDDYIKLDIVKYSPIFTFRNENMVNVETDDLDVIKTEASYHNNTISIILNNSVFSHIKTFLDSGHYYTAVEESYKVVRTKLKEITGEEKANNAFNRNNYIKIFGKEPGNDAEKDFFDGVKFLHMSIQMLRNEKSHTKAQELDKNLALHYIVLASLAYDLISRE